MIENKYWLALYTKPKQEKKAKEQLDKLGIDNYLATLNKIKKWSDRLKQVEEVVLKSYIFIYATEKERLIALELPSIVRCLYERGRPALIPNWQIENLKIFLQNVENVFVDEIKLKGKKVIIKDGPFAGVIGTIQKSLNGCYLSVSLDFINRTFTAIVPEYSVEFIEFIEEKKSENKLHEEFMSKF